MILCTICSNGRSRTKDYQFLHLPMGKEAKQIDPLLFLKIIVPFAIPLLGFVLPPLFPLSTLDETDSYESSFQDEDENSIQEEDERGGAAEYQQQMDSHVINSQTELVTQNVVSMEQVEEEPSLQEEIERLFNRVSDIEERETQLQLEFSEYCNVKKYESLVEKLQIMCLGLKTEYLEKQNQRLEESITKLTEEKHEFEALRDQIKSFRKNLKEISKENKHNFLMVHQKMQDFEAREAELLKRNKELEMAVRDAKDMLQKKNCTSKVEEVEELTIEQGHAIYIAENKETLNKIDRIRAEWTAEMEERIYLGWITTCLRHDISITNRIEESKHESKLEPDILTITSEPTVTVPTPTETKEIEETTDVPLRSDEIQECDEVIQSEPIVECRNSIMEPDENCMDIMVRKGGLNLGKPKLMHKLKGWAKGKGKCKRS